MLIVVVTVAVVVLTVVAIVVMVPPYSPSPSPSSSFSAYVGHHWHRRSRFISSSLPPWSSSSSAVVHAVIAIVTISIAIWFVLKSPFIRPRIIGLPRHTRLPRLTRLGRGSPGVWIVYRKITIGSFNRVIPGCRQKTNERQASFQNEL